MSLAMDNSMPAIMVTLDTSVVYDWLSTNKARSGFQKLLDLAEQGTIDLAVTRRICADIPEEPLASRIEKLPETGIMIKPAVIRLGLWKLGVDALGDSEFIQFTGDLEPSDEPWKDFDHVHAHYVLRRDVFLTNDTDLLDVCAEFRSKFGIQIMKPGAFLKQFDEK